MNFLCEKLNFKKIAKQNTFLWFYPILLLNFIKNLLLKCTKIKAF